MMYCGLKVVWGDSLLSVVILLWAFYTCPHRNLEIYPFCWVCTMPFALCFTLSDLTWLQRLPTTNHITPLHSCQES